jgi:hypothetical protein
VHSSNVSKAINRRGLALRTFVITLCLVLAACGPYPRDISGTLDAIERTGRVRVGFADLRPQDVGAAEAFVARIEKATGAQADIARGPVDSQIARLESGELDLVIGEFAEDSPWISEAAIIEPLQRRKVQRRTLGLSPVAANGENRWIALLEREVRDSGEARK